MENINGCSKLFAITSITDFRILLNILLQDYLINYLFAILMKSSKTSWSSMLIFGLSSRTKVSHLMSLIQINREIYFFLFCNALKEFSYPSLLAFYEMSESSLNWTELSWVIDVRYYDWSLKNNSSICTIRYFWQRIIILVKLHYRICLKHMLYCLHYLFIGN